MKFKTLSKSLLVAAIAAGSVAAQAADFYAGANIGRIAAQESGIETQDFTSLNGRLGATLTENFSAEIRYGRGIGDDNFEGIKTELGNFYGAYARAGMEVAEGVMPYAVVGYTRGTLKASYMTFSDQQTEGDMSYGVGIDFDMSDASVVNVEYMNYFDKDGVELSGITIGAAFKF